MKNKNKHSNKKKSGYYYSQVGRLPSSDSDIDVEFEVQNILSHRIKKKYQLSYFFDSIEADSRKLSQIPNNQLEFLVHWKGYDDNFQTWEPGQNLQNAPTIINQYRQKYSNSMHTPRASASSLKKGRKSKPKSTQKNQKPQPRSERPSRGLKFDKVFVKDVKNAKEDDDSDELCLIDKVTFVERTKNDKNKQRNINIKNSQQRHQNSQEGSAQFKSLGRGKSFEIEIGQQQIPINEQAQKQFVDRIDKENLFMPENYCREFESYPIEMPSRSLSSYLNQYCQNQKNESKMLGNNISIQNEMTKQNVIKEKADKQNKEQADKQNSDIQIQEILKLYQFKKMSEAELANIFDDSQNSKQTNKAKNQVVQKQNQPQQDKQELSLIVEKNKHRQLQFKQASVQINKKRERQHEYNPLQTGQNITKKLKLNTQILQNCTQPQQILISDQNLQQHHYHVNNQPNEEGFQSLLRKTAETYLKNVDLTENIPKISLTQRIDRQIKSLYEIQPINLLQESDQSNGKEDKKNLVTCTKGIDNLLGYKNCRQCNKTKNSYDLLVDYMKFHLKEMNVQNYTISLQKIYEEQQTFVLVNGLNPNIDMDKSDKVKKLLMLQNQQYLQNVIIKRAAMQQQVDEIAKIYKLAKIVCVRGEWFGVFKTEKLIIEKSHYRYVRIKDLAKSHKQKIVSYLIEKE